MEAFVSIFKDIYTTFLLRDVVGKIVPGTILIICLLSLFVPWRRIVAGALRPIHWPILALTAGVAWTIMLGLQSASESLGIWRYYPPIDRDSHVVLQEMTVQTMIQGFLHVACTADRQQYERFVVIKEATGNMLTSLILAGPMAVLSLFIFSNRRTVRRHLLGSWPIRIRTIAILLVYPLVLWSLYGMNQSHISKQYYFARNIFHDRAKVPCDQAAPSSPVPPAHPSAAPAPANDGEAAASTNSAD